MGFRVFRVVEGGSAEAVSSLLVCGRVWMSRWGLGVNWCIVKGADACRGDSQTMQAGWHVSRCVSVWRVVGTGVSSMCFRVIC